MPPSASATRRPRSEMPPATRRPQSEMPSALRTPKNMPVLWLKRCVFIALLILVDGVTPRRSLSELPPPMQLTNNSYNFDTNAFNSYVNVYNQHGTDSYIHYEQQNALSSLINMAYEAIFYKNTSTPGVVCNYDPPPVRISSSCVLPPVVIKTINDLISEGVMSLPNNCTDSNVLQALANAMDQANINAQDWQARPAEILCILGIVLGTVLCMLCWCPRVCPMVFRCWLFSMTPDEVRIRRLTANRVTPETGQIRPSWYVLTKERLRSLRRSLNRVMPFAEYAVTIQDVERQQGEVELAAPRGGSRKNTHDFIKTKEKFGTHCIYLSKTKRNAKYLKVNGEFVAYKTAIKLLTKKRTS